MAYTATITKESVTRLTDDDYQVSIHVFVKDELENIILEKDYSERYYSALDVDTVRLKLQNQIKADWDKYLAEQTIYNAAQFDGVISQLESALNTYINA